MSLLWAASFAVCYRVSQSIVSKDDFLAKFWGFAFLPLPPRSLADLRQIFWQLINVLQLLRRALHSAGRAAFGVHRRGVVFSGHVVAGAKVERRAVFLLVSPIFFALAASTLHQYPFHGRLLLFLMPSVHLLFGEGAAALSRPGGAKLTFALGAFLLAQPAFEVVWHRAIQRRSHTQFDSHGDLRPDFSTIWTVWSKPRFARRRFGGRRPIGSRRTVNRALADERSGVPGRLWRARGRGVRSAWRSSLNAERAMPRAFSVAAPMRRLRSLRSAGIAPEPEAFDDLESPLNLGIGFEALAGLGLPASSGRTVAARDPNGIHRSPSGSRGLIRR